ncbi:MAG: HNH endonuclease [Brevinematales bacterium]|nr:HNH endonuclease [Brevinematales bacterium]
MIKIVIGNQEIFLDKKDLKGLDLSNLRISSGGYAMIGEKLLHRIIMNAPEDMEIDHKNLNKLDNRRQNLRVCSHSENMMNRGKQKNNSTGFKGVNLDKGRKRKRFRAKITANKKNYCLGSFKKPEAAAAAYAKAAKLHHGQFARVAEGKNHET